MKKINGWWFPDADNFMAGEMTERGTYQEDHLVDALGHVKDFRLAVDGGAHIGTWSRILSEKFEKVISFEPSPDTAEALIANMEQFGCKNVSILQEAISDKHEKIRMTLEDCPEENARGNTGARYIASGGDIPATPLDSLALPHLDFLKLDIEGAELKALTGARRTLARCRPVVLFEDKRKCQRHFGVNRQDIYKLMQGLGFKRAQRSGCDEIWVAA